MIKALMYPKLHAIEPYPSGILRVVQAYHRYGKDFDIDYVDCTPDMTDSYDVLAVHAGMTNQLPLYKPVCSHLHGLYFTGDYDAAIPEWKANRNVIYSIRVSDAVTVPSDWVAVPLQRDMHIDPFVIPHGIEWEEWQHDYAEEQYLLWNKNRSGLDVCSPEAVGVLARKFSNLQFVTTFAPNLPPENVLAIGLLPHEKMKKIVQHASIYLSTVQETFCIGALEALASGVPVLAFADGNIVNLVKHGETGFLAQRGNYDQLAYGLEYCMEHRKTLSENAREFAKLFTWDKAMPLVYKAYEKAIKENNWEHIAPVIKRAK